MTDPGLPEFPAAKDDDDDDVAWALSTAAVQWKRGSQADAVVWLRRAIDSAVSVSATWRAAELTRQTDELEQYLLSGASAVPAPRQPQVVDSDDFDGTDMIDAEAMSLPPDDDLESPSLSGDSTDERTDVTSEQEPGIDEEEVQEIDDDEIAVEDEVEEAAPLDEIDDLLGGGGDKDDDLLGGGGGEDESLPRFPSEAPSNRFPSEAPTANFAERGIAALLEGDPVAELDPRHPDPLPYEIEEDPAPTPVRLSVADEEPQPEPEPEPVAEPQPETEPEPEPEPADPLVAGISLAEITGFEDFPPETQLALAKVARVDRLSIDDEVSGFGLALVLRGAVNVMPAIADVACGAARERELIYGKGTLDDGVALRLVATIPDTQVAVWDLDAIEPPLQSCPWVLEELQAVADKYQALAGVSMGPMGDRLDDMLRGMVLDRCKLVRLLPGEVLVEKGKPVGGLFIVGAGRIELVDPKGETQGELGPGDFLFAPQILSAGAAPSAARAGSGGALLMNADRHAAHELMVSVPPLLELLAG